MIRAFLIKYQSFLAAFCFFLLLIFSIYSYSQFDYHTREEQVKDNFSEMLISKASQVEKSVYSRIYYTKGVAAYCSINPDITREEFYQLAAELIRKDSVINSMSLAKDCIISAIYPYKGHESAMGLNLLEHPKRRKVVRNTILTKNTSVAGPVELVEGGIAFISYTPIYTKVNGSQKFWGVTDIVIRKDKLFNEIKLNRSDDDYQYAIRGVDGTGMKGACFFGNPAVFENDPVYAEIYLPTGTWVLAGAPVKGWVSHVQKNEKITILYVTAFVVSGLIWLLVNAVQKIRINEREFKAIFGAMQDIVILFNEKGEYVKIAPTNENLLVKPSKELLGKSLREVFDKEQAEYFMNSITKCLRTKSVVVLNYPLEINGKKLWFRGRITYVSENSVMYVAHEYTAQREAEEHLEESRQQLIELNAAKDKFFSIIAHDLKGPFLGYLGISEDLKENVSKMSHEEISELAAVMHSSAKKTYSLLNNLLEWSRLQTGKMKMVPEEIHLRSETELCCNLFEIAASVKSIQIKNEVANDIGVMADINMLNTVLRNLISNAVKFTREGGTIKISSEIENGMAKLSVADDGQGIKPEVLERIFRIDSGYSTKGTNGEEGTGLGLILCKELVEKNSGDIKISSIFGNGTTISIRLPLISYGKT